ncbi:CYTH domain-containing protein [Acinetobacter rudis]|uniref:CYTH domain-containing protein n=1 Tax=Acinetobacter rudis CIP 110305 TaxID=421052 RepID=S3N7B4_9GAMM|nr:CYTH domain-containing protein [Acinetobacter rudis]EPF75895.1 hypothetical protein F945_01115 [Acinetobacter rudis CIP 110305]
MVEIELKFQIGPSRRNALLKALDPKKSEVIQLQARYYDTAEQHLSKNRAALRQRLEGDRWIQTLKTAGQSHLHRFEHNIDLGSQSPNGLDLAIYQQHPEALQHLNQALADENATLSLQFETNIQRTCRVIEYDDAHIEISLDIGEIRSGEAIQEIYEVEFELKQGSLKSLLQFSFEWVKKYQLWLDVRSKAEFGHLLSQQQVVSPATQAPLLQLNKKENADFNLRYLILEQLQHLLPNIAAISAQVAEAEHIQQAQLALQHLHLSLSIFKDWSKDPSDKWSMQLNAFAQHFEHLEHIQHMQNTLGALLNNPKTAQALDQDILYAQEKLQNLVKSTQNVQHYLELLLFALAPASQTQKQDLKHDAQLTLQQQYKRLQESLSQVDLADLDTLQQLALCLKELKFSFPLLTQVYDVKNLQKYSKSLNDAQQAAEQYQVLVASASYLQESELEASDWFALGWLTAKQESYAETLLQATEQFLLSRKFLK